MRAKHLRIDRGVTIECMHDRNRIEHVLEEYDEQHGLYKELCRNTKRLLKKLLELEGIPVSSITTRVKMRTSLARKLKHDEKAKYHSASDVTDLIGLRVVTFFEDHVEDVARVIKQRFLIDPDNSVNKNRLLAADRF